MSHSEVGTNDWEEIEEWDGEEEIDERLTITTVHTTTVLDEDYDVQANGDDAFEYIEAHDKPTYSNVVARSRRAARQARKQKATAAKVASDEPTDKTIPAPIDDEDAAIHSEPESEKARTRRTCQGTHSDPEDHSTTLGGAESEGDEFLDRDTRKVRGVHGRITTKERDIKRFIRMYVPDGVPYSRGDNNRDPTFCYVKACRKSDRSGKGDLLGKGKRKGTKKFANESLNAA